MKAWIVTAALLGAAVIGRSAHAEAYCQPWGGNDIRCLASNGIQPGHPGGIWKQDYTFALSLKPETKSYKIVVGIWESLCGFPGFFKDAWTWRSDGVPLPTTGRYSTLKVEPSHLWCWEYYVHDCERPVGTKAACADITSASIVPR